MSSRRIDPAKPPRARRPARMKRVYDAPSAGGGTRVLADRA